ncbi:hypothetical protein [Acinetobacter brisouii]|uniref:hypothetical protein n=1 Tax=Acinetobacter brisouii TaxID=396323 RepID=UPI00124C6E6D|nr:hypothetical protein [Acinetobacter brisouii]
MQVNTNLYGDLILLTTPVLVGANESIGFKTDIFEASDGTEQRTTLKDKARQTLSFSSLSIRQTITQQFNVQWGGIRQLWAVPLYQERQFVGDVGSDFITCNTDIYDFRDNSLALLKNDAGVKLVEIIEVQATGLQLSEVTTFKNAKLYPVRVCFINGDITRNISGIHASMSVDFIVVDEPVIEPETPVQFLGDDLYFFNLTYSGDAMQATISQQQNIFDNGIGDIYQSSDWNFARYGKPYRAVLKGQQQIHDYKNFLFRRQGRYRPFWLPTYESNLRSKSTGIVADTLFVEVDQYKQLADQRQHIAIKCDGVWTAHTITASSFVSASTVQLTLTPALDKAASSIQRISYLGLHRLDADSVTLNYQGAGMVEVSVPILELEV